MGVGGCVALAPLANPGKSGLQLPSGFRATTVPSPSGLAKGQAAGPVVWEAAVGSIQVSVS